MRTSTKTLAILGGVGTTLIVMSMMSVGNAPFQSGGGTCSFGSDCTLEDLKAATVDAGLVYSSGNIVANGNIITENGAMSGQNGSGVTTWTLAKTGVGTFNVLDAGAVYTGLAQVGTVDAGTIVVTGNIQMATGKNVYFNAAGTTVIMDNAGQLVFQGTAGGVRTPGDMAIQGTATLGNASADYLTVAGQGAGSGPRIRANSSGADSPLALDAKGAGAVTFNSASASISSTGAGSFATGTTVDSLPLILDGNAGAQMMMQVGSGAMTAGSLAVTFTTAFSAAPKCNCTHVNTTNANPCNLSSAAVPTTTTATFVVASGGTDVVHWNCVGAK